MTDRPEVDATDLAILRELRDDGRCSVTTLAGRVGVSRANAYQRLDRLTREGVIRRFTVEVDEAAVGLPVSALVLVDVEQPRWAEAQAAIAGLESVAFAGLAGGDHDIVVLVRVRDIEAIRDTVLRQLHSIPGVRSTRTLLMLDEIVHRTTVLPPTSRSDA